MEVPVSWSCVSYPLKEVSSVKLLARAWVVCKEKDSAIWFLAASTEKYEKVVPL